MVRHVFFDALLAVAVLGCEQREPPLLREVEKAADRAIARLGEPNLRDPLWQVDSLIESNTNQSVRATCLRILQDKLLAVELRGDDYARLGRAFWWVWVGLMPYRWSETGRWTILDECNARIRQFGWMRRELNRWKAMSANGTAGLLKKENPHRFEIWRRSYRKCLNDYESLVSSFERTFDSDCAFYKSTDKERARAKALVEAFLGRPLRTKEELDKDRQERKMSDEMRALQ